MPTPPGVKRWALIRCGSAAESRWAPMRSRCCCSSRNSRPTGCDTAGHRCTCSSAGVHTCWLVDVSDAAVERPPTPARDPQPADGGMGLPLVSRLSTAHGWTLHGEREHVCPSSTLR